MLELLLPIVSEALLEQELVIWDEAWFHFNSLTADMLMVQNLQLCQLLLGEHCLDDVPCLGCVESGRLWPMLRHVDIQHFHLVETLKPNKIFDVVEAIGRNMQDLDALR